MYRYLCSIKNVKRYITISLIGLFLSTIVGPAFTIANFYMNQTEIIEEFCENKAKPELNCQGNCHLTKKLSSQVDNVPAQEKNQLNLSIFLPIAFNDLHSIVIKHPRFKKNYNSYYNDDYTYVVMNSILHPPQV